MPRYIDADALLKRMDENEWSMASRKTIKDAPTIDAVEVVRCKDCKQYNTTNCSKVFGWCDKMNRVVHDDFYCANGAKMESEGST
mgnify:CR=1 FL=1